MRKQWSRMAVSLSNVIRDCSSRTRRPLSKGTSRSGVVIATCAAVLLSAILVARNIVLSLPGLRSRRRASPAFDSDHLPSLWSHNWTYFSELERVYTATCAPTVAAALAAAQSDRRGLSCVGEEDDPSRYCFAREVCVSAAEGAFLPVPPGGSSDDVDPAPPLRMHAAYAGYCGAQMYGLPMRQRGAGTVIQHGPVVVGDLCECSHYAHGIGTNTYGLFGQALRLSLGLHNVAVKPGHESLGPDALLRATHLLANRMYGTQKPSTGRRLQGEPMQGMIEPIFVPTTHRSTSSSLAR